MKREIVSVIALIIVIVITYLATREILFATCTTQSTIVVDCTMENGNQFYTVVVEDSNGEQYAYFDDEYINPGTEIVTTMEDDEVIDAIIK